jgi:predicted Zn-dependent peptidase
MLKKYKLENGLRIIELKRKSDIVTVQINVNVGSINETKKVRGISHFMEHMVFEGTNKRNSEEIANSIESLGGQLLAYTSEENTCFFVKIKNDYFEKALDILSDILISPCFKKNLIERERKIILSEVSMVKDQPLHYQFVLFSQALFDKFPAKNPIYGSIETIKSITRKDLVNYHKKFYNAPNMVLSVVGDVKNCKEKVKKYFKKTNKNKVKVSFKEEKNNRKKTKIEKRKINQSYAVLGYKIPKRSNKDSYVFDVIRAVLGRGLSGKLFREIRIKHGLAYDVGVYNEPGINYGIFAVYFSTNKKNIKECIRLTLNEFKKLKNIAKNELDEAKNFIEGEFAVDNEDSQKLAANLNKWEISSKAEDCIDYVKKIKKVSKKDISTIVDKYLNEKYSIAVIEQS